MTNGEPTQGAAARALESLGRIRMQGLALLAIAFLVGAIAGGAIVHARQRRPPEGFLGRRGDRGGFGGDRRGRGGLPPMFDELGLSADQRTKIQAILDRRRPVTDSILRASLPRLRQVMDSTRGEIRALLTPEQRDKLDRMERERRARGGWMDSTRGPGAGGQPPAPAGPPPP
ncbi:MAG TPA: hypothetical protein VEI06_17580 [Gemmatimonadaceae bacterium]|nr:hypothetical protein [Gemmatimonadaceae bacterium]